MALKEVDPTSGRCGAITAAVLSLVSTALLIAMIVGNVRAVDAGPGCDFRHLRQMNVTCVRAFWQAESSHRGVQMTFSLAMSIASVSIIPAFTVSNEMFRAMGRPSQVLVPAILGSAIIRVLEFTFSAGVGLHSDFVATQWGLDDNGLVALTISYWTVQSQGIWIFTLDDFLLGVGLLTFAVLSWKVGTLFPRSLAIFAVIAACLAELAVILEIARLGSWFTLQAISGLVAALFGFIVFPIFLLVLAWRLKAASAIASSALGSSASLSAADDAVELSTRN